MPFDALTASVHARTTIALTKIQESVDYLLLPGRGFPARAAMSEAVAQLRTAAAVLQKAGPQYAPLANLYSELAKSYAGIITGLLTPQKAREMAAAAESKMGLVLSADPAFG